eukprot:TRINITY_DN3062_c0_g2_i1.p1 TRINITY_DN3062_c0_g2~~TRINITY_DN3062_c0_g2_i1.p1  ORF type:complete len:325 (-),score=44.33 TRINITY_DN3062_c0_g2_i1:295-1269(-)
MAAAPSSAVPARVLITGANVGIGFECARQLALLDGIEKVIITCRSAEKGAAAKDRLTKLVKKDIFQVVPLELSNLKSVKDAVEVLSKGSKIDGVILNAGGAGGAEPKALTADGVTNSIAANVLGHVVLVEEMIRVGLLSGSEATVIYSGSESARGVPQMKLPAPKLQSGSIDEFKSICDGRFFPENVTKKNLSHMSKFLGAHSKYVGTMWMSSMARQHNIRFVTISPGATAGTTTTRDLPLRTQIFVRTLVRVLSFVGVSHTVRVGARRYIDALMCPDLYQSGVFYGSKKGLSGAVVDQTELLDDFAKKDYQDNANAAIHAFLK